MSINRPVNLSKPFAADGGRSVIPVDSQIGSGDSGAASYTDGFPPLTRTPIAAGGIPPKGLDMNGVLYDVSAHTVFQNAGGQYRFDAELAAAIGGYPKGVVLQSDDGLSSYVSLVDDNHGDFNTDPSVIGVSWAPYSGKDLAPNASTTARGLIEIATATEAKALTDKLRAITPETLGAVLGSVATRDVVASITDTTPNRIPTTGWLGHGDRATHFGGLREVGTGRVMMISGNDPDLPFIGDSGAFTFGNQDREAVIAVPVGAKRMYFTTQGDFENWFEIYHTGRFELVGIVAPFAGGTPPRGWLLCNGAAINRTTYAQLFDVTGTIYGEGDGIATFNIPDLRGEYVRGLDNGRGVDVGRILGSHQMDALQTHGHRMHYRHGAEGSGVATDSDGLLQMDLDTDRGWSDNLIPVREPIKAEGSSVEPRIADETRTRNLAMNFIIKY